MQTTIRFAAFLLAVIVLSGCAAAWFVVGAGLGAGAYKYAEGSLERDYALSYESAWEATNTALSNRFISVKNSINEDNRGKIEGIREDGKNVFINLKYKQNNVTSINIRVGDFGDREEAKLIHKEISAVSGLR